MMATALTWAELCESPAPASINAPAVATLYGRQRPYTSNAWTVRQRWNWLHLNRGIQFPHLVAAAGSDLGRFAVSTLNRAETSSPVSKWNALTFICRWFNGEGFLNRSKSSRASWKMLWMIFVLPVPPHPRPIERANVCFNRSPDLLKQILP